VCEDGQIFLHQHKCGHSGFIDVCAAHLVVYAQYVGVSRTVRITIYGTLLPISSLNSDAASEVWTSGYLHLTCVRQALCRTCWNCTVLRVLTGSMKWRHENCRYCCNSLLLITEMSVVCLSCLLRCLLKYLNIFLTRYHSTPFPGRGKMIFPVTSVSRPALGPTQPPVQWLPWVLSPGLKHNVTLTTHP
jgi:hypothetical protein